MDVYILMFVYRSQRDVWVLGNRHIVTCAPVARSLVVDKCNPGIVILAFTVYLSKYDTLFDCVCNVGKALYILGHRSLL